MGIEKNEAVGAGRRLQFVSFDDDLALPHVCNFVNAIHSRCGV